MNKHIKAMMFYLAPVVFVGASHFIYFKGIDDAADPNDSRVRYLEIPAENRKDMDSLDEIYVEGEINGVILKEFKETVARHGLRHAKVVFNSKGGDLMTAMELGYLIRNNGFATDVGEYNGTWNDSYAADCLSACTMAFLGGKFRYFHPNSRFGVHQYRTSGYDALQSPEDAEADAQEFSGLMLDYVLGMGVDPEFYEITVAQEHQDIEFIGFEELVKLGAVNNGAMEPEWMLATKDNQLSLTGRQERLGQKGMTVLSCSNGLQIEFTSSRRKYKKKDISGMEFSLYADGREIDIPSLTKTVIKPEPEESVVVAFWPSNDQIMHILGAESFGLTYRDAGGMAFAHYIDIDKDRSRIADFVRFCTNQAKGAPQ